MKKSIFISYRREGSSWSTRTLHDRLARYFGENHVFMDIADIDFGTDFSQRIEKEVGRCDVVLAVISPAWLTAEDDEGNRRLDDPNDYVRLEVEMGLRRHIPVIPILIDGAMLPGEGDLPDELKALSKRHAKELRHEHFDTDILSLLESLEKSLSPIAPAKREPVPVGDIIRSLLARLVGAGPVGVAVVLILVLFWYFTGDSEDTGGSTEADNAIAFGGDVNVGGDLTINQQDDPALVKVVGDTLSGLIAQLEIKDQRIKIRDEQTSELSAAIAALAREGRQADEAPEIDAALESLSRGDTEQAKAVFQQILDRKSAEAKAASMVASAAALHLGALAALTDEEQARDAYRQAIALESENVQAQRALAAIENEPGKFRLQAILAEGEEPIETCFYVYDAQQDIDGNRRQIDRSCSVTARFTLPAGTYYVLARTGKASVAQDFALAAGEMINTIMILEGGQFRLQAVLADGAEPIESCFDIYHSEQNIDGDRIKLSRSCGVTARFTLDAGSYYVLVQMDNARVAQEFDLAAGEMINTIMNLEGGQFRLQAVLAAGAKPIKTCFSIYQPEQDVDGNRREIDRACDVTARFTLDAGNYYVAAQAGEAGVSKEFSLSSGQLINEILILK